MSLFLKNVYQIRHHVTSLPQRFDYPKGTSGRCTSAWKNGKAKGNATISPLVVLPFSNHVTAVFLPTEENIKCSTG